MTSGLIVRHNRKGRGVYATRHFRHRELICTAPVFVWPRGARPDPDIWVYIWQWGKTSAIPFGLISLFNHADHPNTGVRRLYARRRMTCYALHDITRGEEITINYGAAADNFKHL